MQNDIAVINVNINDIVPNKYQPRKYFDEKSLNELAISIKNYGIINPILVRKKEDKYEIIAGERRFRAAKIVGLTQVPVLVKNATEQQITELALLENLGRQELTPIEEAKAYEEIIKIGNYTQESLAEKIGKSQPAIANKIRLLSLPIEIQDALSNRKISERHARSLIKLKDKEEQIDLLNEIILNKLTVKETEYIIKEIEKEKIKEEKEDENMNNGNFFPNFDNNMSGNNASLNSMNFESMNQPIPTPEPENVMPTLNQPTVEAQVSAMPNEMVQPSMINVNPEPVNVMPNQPVNIMPEIEIPFMNNNVVNQPVQNIEQPNNFDMNLGQMQQPTFTPQPAFTPEPVVEQPVMTPTMPETPVMDTPLFNPMLNQINETVQPNQPVQPVQEPQIQVETPAPVTENVPNINETFYEVPVNISPVIEPVTTPEKDKFTEVKELLSQNGIAFKAYNGETGNCIIIEL